MAFHGGFQGLLYQATSAACTMVMKRGASPEAHSLGATGLTKHGGCGAIMSDILLHWM